MLKVHAAGGRTDGQRMDALMAYQRFCWSLVCTHGEVVEERWRNPVQVFIWLMALRDDGSFIQASNLTPLLAKLKYFCRLTVLYEALIFNDPTTPAENRMQ